MDTPRQFLTPREVAHMLALHPRTLENWRTAKSGPFKWVKVGKLVRYYAEDVEDYVRRNTHEPSVRAHVMEDRNVRL